jgi:hypothetical protein
MANSTRMLALFSLRYDSALCGHAMPFEGVSLTIGFGVCGKFSGPVFATLLDRSVPISRGSTPIYDV